MRTRGFLDALGKVTVKSLGSLRLNNRKRLSQKGLDFSRDQSVTADDAFGF